MALLSDFSMIQKVKNVISFFSWKLNFTTSKNSSSHRTRFFFIFFQSNYFSPRSSCLLDCIAHCVSFFCEMTQFVRSHRDQEEEEAWSWLFSIPASDLISTLTDSRKPFLNSKLFNFHAINNICICIFQWDQNLFWSKIQQVQNWNIVQIATPISIQSLKP